MSIETKEDWWKEASIIIPSLPLFASQFNLGFNGNAALGFLDKKDHKSLYGLFYDLWCKLPDVPEIEGNIFSTICGLCSEYWIFEKEDDND